MGLTKYNIGFFVEPYNEKCGIANLLPEQVSGINIDKEFFEPARQVGDDTSSYKVVPPHYFACNLMHVGRDEVLPIALNHSSCKKVVSPAYSVFNLIHNDILLKEYFFILLKSTEKDRYFWFHTDSSIRQGLSWDDFCDIDIYLPSLDEQRKYVDVYLSLQNNLEVFRSKAEELKLVLSSSIDRIKKSSPQMRVGEILSEIDCRNTESKITSVKGINIEKKFIDTVADTNGLDLSKYKVVNDNEFAFSGMQTGRDECIRIALNQEGEPIIVSPAYTVLKVCNDSVLSSFIMLWFSRKEVDRYGWFASDASIRSNLDLDRFFDMNIPIPSLDIQEDLVKVYHCFLERLNIASHLKELLTDICPILIKGSLQTNN